MDNLAYIWRVKLKKIGIFIFVLLIAVFLVPRKVSADMIDKPTARIEVVGMNQPYKIEILIEREIYELDESDIAHKVANYYDREGFPLDLLLDYQDEDGYVSRTLYSGAAPANLRKEAKDKYVVGYYSAPAKFKVAIILGDDTIITSKVINRRMYHSQMKFDLTGVDFKTTTKDAGDLKEIVPYGHISWRLVVRVIVTILVELGILYLFMYRDKKTFKIVGITNLVTQTLLTIFMYIAYYFWLATLGLILVLIIGELLVFTGEMIYYRYTLKEKSKSRAVLYGFVANLVTLILSFITITFV